ncbi:unnamed protein product [Diamesa hyperborea]
MDAINSVSKGIFVFKNGPSVKSLRKQNVVSSKASMVSDHGKDAWYKTYRTQWQKVEEKIEKIQSESYGKTLSSLLSFIQNVDTNDANLQTAVLLTGVNQTDHLKQFDSLSDQIRNNCYSIPTILQSRDSPNLKSAVESLVSGLLSRYWLDDDEDESPKKKLKKRHQTFQVLEAWYNENYKEKKPKLVIMLTDFEQFSPQVMQDLIGILTGYTSKLPIVLVLGIATAFKTLHNVLPFYVTSKMNANIFQSDPSTVMLNKILDEVILNHNSPFHLSGKSFKILMDIFLFYDYSLNSFIQGYKVFMLEHYYKKFSSLLPFHPELIPKLDHEQCDYLRRNLPSFRVFVEAEENPQTRIDLLEDDKVLKINLAGRIVKLKRYWFQFHCALRILVVLIEDLPRNGLGKYLRELYPICSTSVITKQEEFIECAKLLKFSSKEKFIVKLTKVLETLETFLADETVDSSLKKNTLRMKDKLVIHRERIENSGMSPEVSKKQDETPIVDPGKKGTVGRAEMMEKLKKSANNNQARIMTEFESELGKCVDFFVEIFEKLLVPVSKSTGFIELSVFQDSHAVRRQIVGAPRGAVHTALSNPHHYLQCKCCSMEDEQEMISTLPDICIAYKLHLECNKFINLFDWLQAFSTVVSKSNDEDEDIQPEVQARFTRAIAELQFLGMIKQAKQKADHVMRQTW